METRGIFRKVSISISNIQFPSVLVGLKYAFIQFFAGTVKISLDNAPVLMATICFDSSKIGRNPIKIKPILPGKKRRQKPVISK